ncbi:MAG: YifB family Mg chelatase-like AAA ATPase [Parvibaculales bacterium]
MVARITTLAFQGIDAVKVDVQVHLSPGKMVFNMVGLPDKAVAESRERVRSALAAIGLGLPPERITVNLAPADLPKEGSHYDLPIALGLMVAMGAIEAATLEDFVAMGELSLDGRLSPVPGVLPAAVAAMTWGRGLICPQANGREAYWSGLTRPDKKGVIAGENLLQIVNHLKGTQLLPAPEAEVAHERDGLPDLRDIRGQEEARLALEVAAAGGHNLLMSGPPGAGKSMLAARLPGILPPLEPAERLETSMIASLSGRVFQADNMPAALIAERPFRAPHHSASMAALIGGGRQALPGEISLAHNGVLFLDELPEFSRQTLDALRQPIETGRVEVARAAAHVTYPARFQLIAAMNPCRCGHANDPQLACNRLPHCMQEYLGKLSGPLLDRFDIRISVPAVKLEEMIAPQSGEDSATVSARVLAARKIQWARNEGVLNAHLDGERLYELSKPEPAGQKLLESTVEKKGLTARGFNRILRVTRTLADLAGVDTPQKAHVASALIWRGLADFTGQSRKSK